MEIYTWKTPKNNHNTEKFLMELKCLPDEEWIEKKFGDIGSFRCFPCTKSQKPLKETQTLTEKSGNTHHPHFIKRR